MAFFTALFTVLGQNIATLLSVALGLGASYCLVSPKGRLLVKGAFNWMFATAANNPKLAAGVFDEKLRQLRDTLSKAAELDQKSRGALAELQTKAEEAKREYEKYTKQALILEKRGEHEEAILVSRKAIHSKTKADNYNEQIPNYTAISEATAKRVNEVRWLITDVEQRKQLALDNMEKGQLEKQISEELMGLNVSEIDACLKQIEDNADSAKYAGVGARLSYESSDQKRLQSAEEKANSIDAESFLQDLLQQENNN